MKRITEQQYNQILESVSVPSHLKEALRNQSNKEQWEFVGVDFD